jgi:hypothetical protein
VLTLVAQGGVEGRVTVDPEGERPAGCETPKNAVEVRLAVVSVVRETDGPELRPSRRSRETAPDRSGSFAVEDLAPSRYRIELAPGDDDLYVASVLGPKPDGAGRAPDLGRDGIAVAEGKTQSGVTVRLVRSAASVKGRVEQPTGRRSGGAVVYLVPAERADADNALLYREVAAAADGTFEIRNVAPGAYRVVARPAPDRRKPGPARAAWSADTRAALRAAAEKSGRPLALSPCQRAADVVVTFAPSRQ